MVYSFNAHYTFAQHPTWDTFGERSVTGERSFRHLSKLVFLKLVQGMGRITVFGSFKVIC